LYGRGGGKKKKLGNGPQDKKKQPPVLQGAQKNGGRDTFAPGGKKQFTKKPMLWLGWNNLGVSNVLKNTENEKESWYGGGGETNPKQELFWGGGHKGGKGVEMREKKRPSPTKGLAKGGGNGNIKKKLKESL